MRRGGGGENIVGGRGRGERDGRGGGGGGGGKGGREREGGAEERGVGGGRRRQREKGEEEEEGTDKEKEENNARLGILLFQQIKEFLSFVVPPPWFHLGNFSFFLCIIAKEVKVRDRAHAAPLHHLCSALLRMLPALTSLAVSGRFQSRVVICFQEGLAS